MSIAKKLQIPSGESISLTNPPAGFKIDAPIKFGSTVLLLFARASKSLKRDGMPVFDAEKQDKLSWIAYPKGGKLDTDLDRDKLAELAKPIGIQPVCLVSLDATWSAMRFRPA